MKSRFIIKGLPTELDAAIEQHIQQSGIESSLFRQLARSQQSLPPAISAPLCLLFAAEHGLHHGDATIELDELLDGTATLNQFCRDNDIQLQLVDAGMAEDYEETELIVRKIRPGSEDCSQSAALSVNEMGECIVAGAELVDEAEESNLYLLSGLEHGNEAATALIYYLLGEWTLEQCSQHIGSVSPQFLSEAVKLHDEARDNPYEVLRRVGGCDIAMLVGAMQAAAEHGKNALALGHAAHCAYLLAQRITPKLSEYVSAFANPEEAQQHYSLLKNTIGTPQSKPSAA